MLTVGYRGFSQPLQPEALAVPQSRHGRLLGNRLCAFLFHFWAEVEPSPLY
jgi:hypothetical protein